MREAILEGKQGFIVREAPEPVLDEDEVLIRVKCCGICGSDLHTYVEGIPARYGHEYSGDVTEVGTAVKGWKTGDRVTVESIHPCGGCYWCDRGQTGLCDSFHLMWSGCAGGFATYTKAKFRQLHRLPDEVSYEEGALVEPLAVALHGFRLAGLQIGDTVAVLGLGPIGQLAARLARASGAGAVYVTEASRSRLELARSAADEAINVNEADPVGRILELTGGRGPDIVFECAGAAVTIQQSVTLVRKGGIVVLVGVCLPPVELPVGTAVLKEVTLKGSMCFSAGEYASALELVRTRRIDVRPLISAIMPLDAINKAFEKAVNGEGGKILVQP